MVTIEKNYEIIRPHWKKSEGRTFVCRVWMIPDEDGGFTAIASRLPGVVSEGDTKVEALENIKDAFRESINSYQDDSVDIPWADVNADSSTAFMLTDTVDV